MSTPVFYGKTLSLLSGFVGTFPLAEGALAVGQGMYRRWTTSENSLAGKRIYKGRCRDIRELLAAQLDTGRLQSYALVLQEIAKEDERVDDVVALISYRATTSVLQLRAHVRCGAGPFALLIPFDTFTPELQEAAADG